MSQMKHWFEDHISEMTDKELIEMGWSQEFIEQLRSMFPSKSVGPC